jgi:hypothetical protein
MASLTAVGLGLQGLVESTPPAGASASTARAAEDQAGAAVYRRFGGTSPSFGQSWTTVPPSSVADFRASAGLPATNANTWEIGGMLRDATAVPSRAALPGPGGQGGIQELLIPNAETQVMFPGSRPVDAKGPPLPGPELTLLPA